MAEDTPDLVSMAEQFTGLPMSDLIGGPLNAAATANGMMAATQTKFLLDTAFKYKKDSETYEPIMIKMTLIRGVLVPKAGDEPGDPEIKQFETTFDLPLLTILPLNSLAVDDVTIRFDMEVKSSYSEATSAKTEEKVATAGTFSAKFGYGPFSAEVTGSASYDSATANTRDTHYEKSNSAQYSVSVHAGQLPLPEGVKTIITAFAATIQPIILPKDAPKKDS
ncbi:MAG TPA: DUF2589 domain-containing protein [Thermoanaerobaculia bacterium]|jgi:hypothetical protein|nr:DUF2589 domain-containing protein [Thermoanaerobaculia bacterium]